LGGGHEEDEEMKELAQDMQGENMVKYNNSYIGNFINFQPMNC
jgi:hypothetical protein